MRRIKTFKNELTNCLNDKFDKLLPKSPNPSPKHTQSQMNGSLNKVTRSSSHDSIGSTHSEPSGLKLFRSSTQSDHKSATAAFMNLAGSNSALPLDQRMIGSYSGQTMNSIYATLPANSRICDNKATVESANANSANDITSEYDISCCDLSNLNVSILTNGPNQSRNDNSSFLEADIGDDPAPTDYSQRFMEQTLDDFIPPRCTSKSEHIGEDTVKVYQTEGTPLAFSLAPSLSDLRDLSDIKNSLHDRGRPDDAKSKVNNNSSDLIDRFASLDLSKCSQSEIYKKPHLPPKPGSRFSHSSSSSYNLKNLVSINEDSPLGESKSKVNGNKLNFKQLIKSRSIHESINQCQSSSTKKNNQSDWKVNEDASSPILFTQNRPINSNMCNENITSRGKQLHFHIGNKNSWTSTKEMETSSSGMKPSVSTSMKVNVVQKVTTSEFTQNDCSQVFATEDTPAIFSHTTSLSSLSLNDDGLEDDFNCSSPMVSTMAKNRNSEMNYTHKTTNFQNLNYQSIPAVSSMKSKPMEANTQEVPKEVNQMFDLGRSYPSQEVPEPIPSKLNITSVPAAGELVKPTPKAAKRMSKSHQSLQPPVNSSNVSPIFRRPPKKPLPAIPSSEESSSQKNCSNSILFNHSTIHQWPSGGEEDDYDFLLTKCMQYALPKEIPSSTVKGSKFPKPSTPSSTPNFSRKSKHTKSHHQSNQQKSYKSETQSSKSPDLSKKQHRSNTSTNIKEIKSEIPEDDEDDDLLLSKCIQSAMPKKDNNHRSLKKSSVGHISQGKSPRVYKKNPSAPNATSTNHLSLFLNKTSSQNHMNSEPDQEKPYFVENTPVYFSQCHSPLSSLIDSGDEIEDAQLIEAAVQFDAARNHKTNTDMENSVIPTTAELKIASCSSSSGTHVTSNGVKSLNHNAVTNGNHKIPNKSIVENGEKALISNNTNSTCLKGISEVLDDGDEDDRTYTICTQSKFHLCNYEIISDNV